MNQTQIAAVLTPILARFDLELEAVEVIPAGKRRVLRVVVDGDGPSGTGPLLDDIAEASKALSAALDESPEVGAQAYTLEVSSRGVSRPLTLPRHWRRNAGRLVEISTTAGEQVSGRVIASDADSVELDLPGEPRTLAFSEVSKAMVRVELNRPTPGTDPIDEDEDR